jgi:hypothetical protein
MVDKPAENLFTPDERKSLETLAKRRGYPSLRSYVRALVAQDAESSGEPSVIQDDEDDPVENFRRAWADAMEGRVLSWEEFERLMNSDAD